MDASTVSGSAGKMRPPGGSRKGIPNKATKAIKDMILAALDKAGGEQYLLRQSEENPVAFMGLLAKVMPTQITGEGGGPLQIQQITRRIVRPE